MNKSLDEIRKDKRFVVDDNRKVVKRNRKPISGWENQEATSQGQKTKRFDAPESTPVCICESAIDKSNKRIKDIELLLSEMDLRLESIERMWIFRLLKWLRIIK